MKNGNSHEFKIEKGVPLPPRGKGGALLRALRQMKVGDSILVPSDHTYHQRAREIGIKISQRTQGDKMRLWRVA